MKLNVWKFLVGAAGLLVFPAFCQSSGKFPWEEYDKQISSRASVSTLTGESFGESIDLYNGRISFKQVDIDIPGNSELSVTLARTFSVQDRTGYTPNTGQNYYDLPLATWDLDVPRISGVFAEKYGPTNIYKWPDQRCSGSRSPPMIEMGYWPLEYWHGIHAEMPGGGEMLEPAQATKKPSLGGPYQWVTTGFTWFSCLSSIKNGTGEGFVGVTSDGTKYWFDSMAMYNESMLQKIDINGGYEFLFRKKNVLYATRVEDRFGNWVTYSYSNLANSPARLDRIKSNDGRQIDIAYDNKGWIASATANGRVWVYQYEGNPKYPNGGDFYLRRVILPDSSQWLIDFDEITSINSSVGLDSDCDHPGVWNYSLPENLVGRITHPSGAIGEFEVALRLHGRSNVPRNCVAVPDSNAYSDYVRMYWIPSIVRKKISGPGLSSLHWDYRYKSAIDLDDASYSQAFVPPGSWALNGAYYLSDPVCLSDSCAGKTITEVNRSDGDWSRHTFGNSYRYNEHKILKIERGSGENSVLKVEDFAYELARSGQVFPTPVGISLQYKGDSMADMYLRPLRSRKITQDGFVFSLYVNGFDEFGRPLSITKSSAPVQ